MSKNLGLMLDAVVELRDSGAYLCHVCRKKLEMISSLEDKLAALQKELESLKDEINRKMTQLTPKSIIIGTKRVAVPLISEEHETAATCESLASMGPKKIPWNHSQVHIHLTLPQNALHCIQTMKVLIQLCLHLLMMVLLCWPQAPHQL